MRQGKEIAKEKLGEENNGKKNRKDCHFYKSIIIATIAKISFDE